MNHTLRKFYSKGVQHIYQRAKDKGVIFYDDIDRIVFFSIDSVIAKRYEVIVLGISEMYTHLHKTTIVRNRKQMSKYIQDVSSIFARMYNYRHKRKGELFEERFGSSSKTESKKIRQIIEYQYNNHTEKELCKSPMEERWSFLPYAKSDHPFSQPIDFNCLSKSLKSALRLIDRRVEKGEYLKYSLLEKIIARLTKEETEQFIDYTISKYMHIDFAATASYFKSFEAMVAAFEVTTGAEYGIKEDYDSFPDTEYVAIEEIFRQQGWPHSKIFTSSITKRRTLAEALHLRHGINFTAASKYLHI
jgi:hypothetical protein